MRHSDLAYALLRITIGTLFLFAGIGKLLGGVGEFADGLVERFEETWLPASLVELAGQILPFVEVGLGAALVLGLFTPLALAGAAVLFIILTFGTTVSEDHEAAGRNVLYALVVFALLSLSDRDRYSVDGLRGRRRPPATG